MANGTDGTFGVVVDGAGAEDVVVHVRGDVDVATGPALRNALLQSLADGARRVTIDLSDVTFIDSAGMSVLMSAARRIRSDGGEVVLRSPSDSVRLVLDFSGLSRVFPVE